MTLRAHDPDPIILMSDEARKFKRNTQELWVFDLRSFSEQLPHLRDIQQADLIVSPNDEAQELCLYSLLRYPEYRGFELQSLGTSGRSESLRITWTPQPNDPISNRVLRFYPADAPKSVINKRIEDGMGPPVIVELEPPERPGRWIAQLDVFRRFEAVPIERGGPETKTSWMRIPSDWLDWLEYGEAQSDKTLEYFNSLEDLGQEFKICSMPWHSFLFLFYRGTCEGGHHKLKQLLGHYAIKMALPFSKGSIWEIRTPSKCCARLEVIRSEMEDQYDSGQCFADRTPNQWHLLPDKIELDLRLNTTHRYLGRKGTIWKLRKTERDRRPILSSDTEGVLDLNYWLEDATFGHKTGWLEAKLPLEFIWDNPPYFPVLRMVNVKDNLFVPVNPRNLANVADPGANEKAFSLVDRWKKWSGESGVNRLLARVIRGRLATTPVQTLSGAVAFVLRLRASPHSSNMFTRTYPGDIEIRLDKLLNETLDFTRCQMPLAFLRDLILSEILIAWYWNTSLASKRPR